MYMTIGAEGSFVGKVQLFTRSNAVQFSTTPFRNARA